jgi:hypothetical protein
MNNPEPWCFYNADTYPDAGCPAPPPPPAPVTAPSPASAAGGTSGAAAGTMGASVLLGAVALSAAGAAAWL